MSLSRLPGTPACLPVRLGRLNVAIFYIESALRKLPVASLIFGAICCLSLPLSAGQNSNNIFLSSRYLWSTPDVTILDVATAMNGTVVLLLQDRSKRLALSVGANELGAGSRVPLQNGKLLATSGIHLAAATDGSLWLGATQNIRRSITGAPLSDSYIAKMDLGGRVIREIEVLRNRENVIYEIATLPTGDAVIVGKENDANWLARVSGDGGILWEKTFGSGRIASIAVLNNLIAVIGFDAIEAGSDSASAHVAFREFDAEGRELGRQIVREDVAQNPGAAWLVKAISGQGDFYAATAWTEPWSKPPSAKALSVTRLTVQGQIIWQKNVPETVMPSRLGPMPCPRSAVASQDGGIITFCISGEGIDIIYLQRETGEAIRDLLANTTQQICNGSNGRASFMIPHSASSIWIFGTGGSCSWLQQVHLVLR